MPLPRLCFASIRSLSNRMCAATKRSFTDLCQPLSGEQGQDIAEYAVMLAVILVIVVGTIRLIGTNANNVFSSAASSIQ